MNHKREEARLLRQQGLSLNEIVKITGASKSSVSVWVRDIVLTKEQVDTLKIKQHSYGAQHIGAQANKAKHEAQRLEYQHAGRIAARQKRPLHLIGCMLYWAEGAKARNAVNFVNSDTHMIMLFVRFLREELFIPDEALRLHIHCHFTDPAEIARVERYWLDLLGLPETCLKKTQVKQGSSTRNNVLVNGICGVRVSSTEAVQHIYGAIQEYGGFENPDWLF